MSGESSRKVLAPNAFLGWGNPCFEPRYIEDVPVHHSPNGQTGSRNMPINRVAQKASSIKASNHFSDQSFGSDVMTV